MGWRRPGSRKMLRFEALVALLEAEARTIARESVDAPQPNIVVIDVSAEPPRT